MSQHCATQTRILLTGQCTLHWGRMEFGNIGNFYILEPLVREIHRVFPGAEIRTTFQLSEEFCRRERISGLPMDVFYGWNGRDLATARQEMVSAAQFAESAIPPIQTPYIEEVQRTDLVIDFSGDIFGDNADLLGADRFETGLCKLRTAQLLGKPTAMIAGSPGPFNNSATTELTRKTIAECRLLTTREELSLALLAELGCRTESIRALACPAFLFESDRGSPAVEGTIRELRARAYGRPIVGFVLCGWNFAQGPFDRWPRADDEYLPFAEAIEFISTELGAAVCLLSHANGFPAPPASFRLQHGRDFPIARQLGEIVRRRGRATGRVFLQESVLPARETHAVLGCFDLLVSGRVHAAVAALTQKVPTVIVDYGHEPKAHKLRGFARVAGVEDSVADPRRGSDLISKIEQVWHARPDLRSKLAVRIPSVRALARRNFELLPPLLGLRAPSSNAADA